MGRPGEDAETARNRMVDRQIVERGVDDGAVIAAMRTVPRDCFVGDDMAEFAYDDTALPIGEGQTISQPFIVASMAAAAELQPDSRVLEVGTGSGYGAAVLGVVAGEVWTIERIATLADRARSRLGALGYDNVHVVHGDGTLGLPEQAPFDAVIVTAGGPAVPDALVEQLAEGGTLVIPVGPETRVQRLVRVRRRGDDLVEEDLGPVRFVPLVGDQGWSPHPRA
jgi:protein-L-isoaspartate(D-aspartate) O-methyltransferase